MIRFFMPDYGVKPPVDIVRTEFNVFLRSHRDDDCSSSSRSRRRTTSAAGIATERAKETWNSLIATPLTVRDILRSKMLAALWQMPWMLATVLVLWTIGLIAGAIHPLGYLARGSSRRPRGPGFSCAKGTLALGPSQMQTCPPPTGQSLRGSPCS